MKPLFSQQKQPMLVTSMTDATPLKSISTIRNAIFDGTDGFMLNGAGDGEWTGSSVASAGDFNGDGFDVLVIGADEESKGKRIGKAFVVYGRAQSCEKDFVL